MTSHVFPSDDVPGSPTAGMKTVSDGVVGVSWTMDSEESMVAGGGVETTSLTS
jgi:hypothetical protein